MSVFRASLVMVIHVIVARFVDRAGVGIGLVQDWGHVSDEILLDKRPKQCSMYTYNLMHPEWREGLAL